MNIDDPRFSIRSIDHSSPGDLAQILEVYRQCEDFLALGPVPTASLEMVRADLNLSIEECGDFCGIFDPQSGVMMGIIDMVVHGFEGRADLAFLSLLMISVPYRAQGLGEAVVRAVEAEIRKDGRVRAIRSGVQVNNPGGIRFWLRMGYQIISDAEPMPDGTVCYQLWKTL